MADRQYTAEESQILFEKLERTSSTLRRRIHFVESVTICVRLALQGQNAGQDEEIATTLQRCITDELFSIGKDMEAFEKGFQKMRNVLIADPRLDTPDGPPSSSDKAAREGRPKS